MRSIWVESDLGQVSVLWGKMPKMRSKSYQNVVKKKGQKGRFSSCRSWFWSKYFGEYTFVLRPPTRCFFSFDLKLTQIGVSKWPSKRWPKPKLSILVSQTSKSEKLYFLSKKWVFYVQFLSKKWPFSVLVTFHGYIPLKWSKVDKSGFCEVKWMFLVLLIWVKSGQVGDPKSMFWGSVPKTFERACGQISWWVYILNEVNLGQFSSSKVAF